MLQGGSDVSVDHPLPVLRVTVGDELAEARCRPENVPLRTVSSVQELLRSSTVNAGGHDARCSGGRKGPSVA